MNCLLLIFMILVSCVYTNKNNNLNKNKNENNNNNDIEELMYADSSTDREDTELNKFFEKEKNNNNDLENYMNNEKKSDTEDINMLETSKGKKKAAKKKPKKGKKGSKSSKKTKSKPKKTYPPAKLLSQFNPYYPKKKSLINSNTSASYCKFKKGFLHLVKNSNKLGVAPLTIKTVPVYVSLSMFTFNIQMGLAFKTLFNTVKVKNILKITKKFKNANCFEVVEDNVHEKTLTKSPVTLCAGNTKIMMQWVKALQEFKDCLYNVSSKNTGSRTLMDFNRINTLIKVATPKVKKPKAFNALVYDQGPSVNKRNKKAAKVEYVMKKQLAKIVGLMERGRINKQKISRKMNTKLKSAKKIEYDIRAKQNMINKILNKRERKEKEKEIKIRTQVHKKREIQLLKAVKSRIKQYKKKEVKKLNKIAKGRLTEIKSRANSEAKGLMKAIVNQSKLTPYDECINPKLKNFTDKTYIKSHCMNLYGEEKMKQCMQKKEFCTMCCEFHVGTKFANKRKDCKVKCTNLLYGKKKGKGKGKVTGKGKKTKKGKGKKKSKSKKGKGKKK